MNLKKIYEILIYRGIQRIKKKNDGLHRHRIIPGYINGKYTKDNISYLTRKEHRLVHLIRYKLYNHYADYIAYFRLDGKNTKIGYKQNKEWIEKRKVKEIGRRNKNFVTCKDKEGNIFRVTKQEFYNSDNLRGVNTGGYKLPKDCHKGNKNPMFGKKRNDTAARNKLPKAWVYKGTQNKLILIEQLNYYMEDGYTRGRI